MKTKVKYLMFALVAVFACVSISSCSKDDGVESGVGNYYFLLSGVETNGVDANGNSISSVIKADFITSNKADAQGKISIGKTDRVSAEKYFEESVKSFINAYTTAYQGKLPEGVYIKLTFYLGVDVSYGYAGKYATVEVTNSGARRI